MSFTYQASNVITFKIIMYLFFFLSYFRLFRYRGKFHKSNKNDKCDSSSFNRNIYINRDLELFKRLIAGNRLPGKTIHDRVFLKTRRCFVHGS